VFRLLAKIHVNIDGHEMKILDICTIKMALAALMIVLCAVFMVIDVYIALGLISPKLSIRIEQRARKALNKPPVIILDPWYIRQRNMKWLIWVFVLSFVILFAITFIVVSIR